MNEVTCNKCGWVHAGITAKEFLELHAVHDQYLYCVNCGNDFKDFRLAVEADAPAGVTLQPILETKHFNPTKERMKEITDASAEFQLNATDGQLGDFSE